MSTETINSDDKESSRVSEVIIRPILNRKELRYNCIVFDLDETLVYASKNKKGPSAKRIIFNDRHGDKMSLWIHKRPGFDTILQESFKYVTVGVWSMGQEGYVDAVVSLFPQPPSFVYNWCHCDRDYRRPEGKIFKRLSNIPYDGRILMIEDNPENLETCDTVSVHIVSKWHPRDTEDTTLFDLSHRLFYS